MDIQKEKLLTEYNTFHIPATAQWFITYDSLEELKTLLRDEYFQECRSLSVGEGSNLLFLANFHGIILHSNIRSIEEIERDDEQIVLRVGAGVNWDDFVAYAVKHGYYGIENLSLIPGQVAHLPFRISGHTAQRRANTSVPYIPFTDARVKSGFSM